ncbi:MAG TPA: tyrosine--tRNA ligase [Patescibacteria group bacterium]
MDTHSYSHSSLLTRRVIEVIDRDHIAKRLTAGEKLRVKLGIDTNKPDLHIGHAIPLWKLREFQDAGHTAVLILGDYTSQLGDPTDRSEARKTISEEETKANAAKCLDQVFKILDSDKTEIRYNSEWFDTFNLRDTINLMGATTLNQLLAHETFANRLSGGTPLYTHEILYPLLQGYDSVMVEADLELGGLDQKFNVLMGRTIQRAHNKPEQDVMLFAYLPGTDGQAKMSKSLGNTVNLSDTPNDMFGKVMSIPDDLLASYFELATSLPEKDIEVTLARLSSGELHPRDAKVILAKQIVSQYHNQDAADKAEEHFNKVFRDKQTPEDIETLILPQGTYDLADILVTRSTLISSKSEFRRLVQQRGIKVNQKPVEDLAATIATEQGDDIIIQVGARRFIKVNWKVGAK